MKLNTFIKSRFNQLTRNNGQTLIMVMIFSVITIVVIEGFLHVFSKLNSGEQIAKNKVGINAFTSSLFKNFGTDAFGTCNFGGPDVNASSSADLIIPVVANVPSNNISIPPDTSGRIRLSTYEIDGMGQCTNAKVIAEQNQALPSSDTGSTTISSIKIENFLLSTVPANGVVGSATGDLVIKFNSTSGTVQKETKISGIAFNVLGRPDGTTIKVTGAKYEVPTNRTYTPYELIFSNPEAGTTVSVVGFDGNNPGGIAATFDKLIDPSTVDPDWGQVNCGPSLCTYSGVIYSGNEGPTGSPNCIARCRTWSFPATQTAYFTIPTPAPGTDAIINLGALSQLSKVEIELKGRVKWTKTGLDTSVAGNCNPILTKAEYSNRNHPYAENVKKRLKFFFKITRAATTLYASSEIITVPQMNTFVHFDLKTMLQGIGTPDIFEAGTDPVSIQLMMNYLQSEDLALNCLGTWEFGNSVMKITVKPR